MRILVVSANPRVTAQIDAALVGDPIVDLTYVAAPAPALALLDQGAAFDVVVADNDMAPTGGFHLSREVKARAQMGVHMPPVILLLARPQDRFLANWSQADAHVLKPVDPFDFATVVVAVAEDKPVPALPGVGSGPKPYLAVPGPQYDDEALHEGVPPQQAREDSTAR